MKHYFLLIVFYMLACYGCNNSDNIADIPLGQYKLCFIEVTAPIDINFDGEVNTDLIKEFENFGNSTLWFQNIDGLLLVNLLWPEFLLNGTELLQGLPQKYDVNMDIDYVNVSIPYFVSIDSKTGEIVKGKKKVNDDSIYTFNFPQRMSYDSENKEISFITTQTFLSKEGSKGEALRVKFRYCE